LIVLNTLPYGGEVLLKARFSDWSDNLLAITRLFPPTIEPLPFRADMLYDCGFDLLNVGLLKGCGRASKEYHDKEWENRG
jgi:hypothetical protein